MTEIWLSRNVEKIIHESECKKINKIYQEVRKEESSQNVVAFSDNFKYRSGKRLSIRDNFSELRREGINEKLLAINSYEEIDNTIDEFDLRWKSEKNSPKIVRALAINSNTDATIFIKIVESICLEFTLDVDFE